MSLLKWNSSIRRQLFPPTWTKFIFNISSITFFCGFYLILVSTGFLLSTRNNFEWNVSKNVLYERLLLFFSFFKIELQRIDFYEYIDSLTSVSYLTLLVKFIHYQKNMWFFWKLYYFRSCNFQFYKTFICSSN